MSCSRVARTRWHHHGGGSKTIVICSYRDAVGGVSNWQAIFETHSFLFGDSQIR